jgi:hypothetical protein
VHSKIYGAVMSTTDTRPAGEQIVAAVTTWPDVHTAPGSRGELSIRVGRREIGHLHGDHAAHFGFPKPVWRELHTAGRITHHPVFPGKEGWAARRIRSEEDVRDVIALLRVNYDRVTGADSSRRDQRSSTRP